MISHRRWLPVTIGLLLVVGGIAATLPDATRQRLRRLMCGDLRKVLKAKRELVSEREKKIEALLDIVGSMENQKKNVLGVQKAVDVLGEMRATEAVPTLVRLLSYPPRLANGKLNPGTPIDTSPGLWWSIGGRYSAESALVKIGRPAVPRLWQELRATEHDGQLKSALAVLIEIEGHDEIDRRIEVSLKKTADPSVRENLQFGQRLLEKKKEVEHAGGFDRWIELQEQKREERMKERDARK